MSKITQALPLQYTITVSYCLENIDRIPVNHNHASVITTQNPRLCILIMVRGQPHKYHGQGLATQNPWLWVNHTKPMVKGPPHKTHSYGYRSATQNPWLCIVIMVSGQPHKTHGQGSTTQNPWVWVSYTKPMVMGQPHKTHGQWSTTQNPRLLVNLTKPFSSLVIDTL